MGDQKDRGPTHYFTIDILHNVQLNVTCHKPA